MVILFRGLISLKNTLLFKNIPQRNTLLLGLHVTLFEHGKPLQETTFSVLVAALPRP